MKTPLPREDYIIAFMEAFEDESTEAAKGKSVSADMIIVEAAESHNAAAEFLVKQGYGAEFSDVYWPVVKIRNDLKMIRALRAGRGRK